MNALTKDQILENLHRKIAEMKKTSPADFNDVYSGTIIRGQRVEIVNVNPISKNTKSNKTSKKKAKKKYSFSDSVTKDPRWKLLRAKVLKTYGRECMCCGSKQEIQVDHIKPKSIYPELAFDFNNLQVLCRKCNFDKGLNIIDYRKKHL